MNDEVRGGNEPGRVVRIVYIAPAYPNEPSCPICGEQENLHPLDGVPNRVCGECGWKWPETFESLFWGLKSDKAKRGGSSSDD